MGFSNDLVFRRNGALFILLWFSLVDSTGCINAIESKNNTYPCEFHVYSRLSSTVFVLRCSGLGFMQPTGFLVPTMTKGPSNGLSFPRIPDIPDEITIEWRNELTKEIFTQLVDYPRVPKGSDGVIKMELLSTNKWKVTFEQY